ncbi:MAG: hypothetical protein ACK5HO_04280 [Pseudomonadota bacterium]
MPVKLARLLLDITIGFCFDSHPRIDSVLQNSGFRYGLLENAIENILRSGFQYADCDLVKLGTASSSCSLAGLFRILKRGNNS